MKIAIIGNSYCGCWRRAWDNIANQFPSVTLTFFAAPGGQIKSLSVKSQCLVPDTEILRRSLEYTSDGSEKIDPTLFDLFLVCGLHTETVARYDRPQFSQGLYNRMVCEKFQASNAYQLLKKLREITSKPVYFTPAPLPAYSPERRPWTRGTVRERSALLQKKFLTDLKITFLPQPCETIVDEVGTDPRFSQNSRKLDIGSSDNDSVHSDKDILHMNDYFGELALRAFLGRVEMAFPGELT